MMMRCVLPLLLGVLLCMACVLPAAPQATAGTVPQADDPSPPPAPVKLIFIHHSTGEAWLADDNGGLGLALGANNYFVSDTNYGWGTNAIGDRTDIPNWPEWFTSQASAIYLGELYNDTEQRSGYTRTLDDPGGENQVVLFKSCFPNSDLYGNPDDAPLPAPNDEFSVANAKAVYIDILTYFATRQDKLFVVITAPPLRDADTAPDHADNARAFNRWLVEEWLDGYPHANVAVFDFYNVLTSNGGDADTNDLDAEGGNHHRWWQGAVQHIQPESNNFAAYPTGDSHPSQAGNLKATGEFVPLLNIFYNRWVGGPACVGVSGATIQGPSVGVTNTLYSFSAGVTPLDASTPMTYTWSPAPESGQGTTTAHYRWPATGSQAVNVGVYNCGGQATATHTVEIIPPVEVTDFVYLAAVTAE